MHDANINPSFNGQWSIYFIDTWSMKGIVETGSIFGGPCSASGHVFFGTNAKNGVLFKKQQLTTRIMIFLGSGSLLTFASYHYWEGVLASHLNQASWWILCVLRFANQSILFHHRMLVLHSCEDWETILFYLGILNFYIMILYGWQACVSTHGYQRPCEEKHDLNPNLPTILVW